MATDPIFGWPVPADDDLLADGAAAIRDLAAAVADTLSLALGGMRIQTGTQSIPNVGTVPSLGVASDVWVTFPEPFGGTPTVVCNESGASGGSQPLVTRVLSSGLTAVHFRAITYNTVAQVATVASHAFTWIAVGPA